MLRSMVVALSLLVTFSASTRAEFVGQLAFEPAGCKTAGECVLKFDFGYIDPSGVGWQAKAGLKTDGASIPDWAIPIIGGRWEEAFIKAAVIHDHYCIRTVRPRTATHRMFYYALLESGVAKSKALVMYYGVMVGSHMWTDLMEGQSCNGVQNCIQQIQTGIGVTGGSTSLFSPNVAIRKNDAGQLQAYRAPRFNDPLVRSDIDEASKIIESGTIDTPEAVEALAKRRNPGDVLLNAGASIRFQGPSSRLPSQ